MKISTCQVLSNDSAQKKITNFFPKHKGPLKFELSKITTWAENQALLKKQRQRKRKKLSKLNSDTDDSDVQFVKMEPALLTNEHNKESETSLTPDIIFRTDVGYTKFVNDEKQWESVIYETSPSKKQKLQIPELTVTRSQIQHKERENKGSRTLQMTQCSAVDSAIATSVPLKEEVTLDNIDIGNILQIEVSEDNDSLHRINNHIALIEEIIDNALNTHLSRLLIERNIIILKNFQKMTIFQKYFSCKLFTHQVKWYNACKFADGIHLPITGLEVKQITSCLKEQLIVKADYTSESIVSLLNLLSVGDVKEIHDGLRLKTKQKNKPLLINSILEYTNKQTTINPTMSLDQRVKQMIYKKLGDMVHINPEFYNAFYKAHLLYSFTNPEFTKPSDLYLKMNEIKFKNVVYPDYNCSDDIIFDSSEEFSEFSKARSYKDEVIQAEEKKGDVKYTSLYNLSKEIVKEFADILRKGANNIAENKPKHLTRFTAGHQYAGVLSTLCKHLGAKHPSEVREWLEMLLGQTHYYQKRRGLWYSHLCIIYNTHLKDRKKAVEILIEGLKDEEVPLVQRSEMVYKARSFCKKKKLRSDELLLQLSFWDEKIPDPETFPSICIQALGNDSSEAARRGDYKYMDKNGDVTYMNVEEIAIRHYIDEKGFTEGVHCEGALMQAILYVLFWDIIYTDGVPYSFICKMQYLPLDFHMAEFYTNRKLKIDQRLQDIKSTWPSEYLKSRIYETLASVLDAKLVNIPNCVRDPEKLYEVINCIGRVAVSDICQRLVQHMGNHRAGMPDLFMFNENKCKFVEVKGPGDKLSSKQKLWLNFLLSTGVDAEVCHVTKVGGSRKNQI